MASPFSLRMSDQPDRDQSEGAPLSNVCYVSKLNGGSGASRGTSVAVGTSLVATVGVLAASVTAISDAVAVGHDSGVAVAVAVSVGIGVDVGQVVRKSVGMSVGL